MLEPAGALAVRIGVRDRTKAQVQPAKEGGLNSECEGAARRKLRRRCVCIPVDGSIRGRQFQTSLIGNLGQFLRMLSGVWRDRSYSRVPPLHLTA